MSTVPSCSVFVPGQRSTISPLSRSQIPPNTFHLDRQISLSYLSSPQTNPSRQIQFPKFSFGGGGGGGSGGSGGGGGGWDSEGEYEYGEPVWFQGKRYQTLRIPKNKKPSKLKNRRSRASSESSFWTCIDQIGLVVVPVGLLEITTGCISDWLLRDRPSASKTAVDANGKEGEGK